MSAMKKGLGRGFESLIPTDLIDESFDPTASQDELVSQLRNLPLAKIHADPDQPRRHFDEEAIDELSLSVKEHGVIQPIIVTKEGEGYKIVAGERRYRAAKQAGLDKIPALIRSLTDQNRLELSLIENLQRRDLNVIETATAYAKLRDQFNLTNEAIGERVHKSPSAVNNTMRLLKLPKEVQYLVAEGELTEGQVRPLISWDADFVLKLVPRIVAEGWSARKVEQYLISLKRKNETTNSADEMASKSAVDERAESLKQRLKANVAIRMNSRGAGRIVIGFKNQAELERLEALLAEPRD
ncbi:chromosome partitioning protein ParB [Candidatus Saccharibacteria bacterium 32-49-12]|nr:MAG: chromosome partitioning protein ParB [Candidatus Saccharibacteria bacterium 32-49-12]